MPRFACYFLTLILLHSTQGVALARLLVVPFGSPQTWVLHADEPAQAAGGYGVGQSTHTKLPAQVSDTRLQGRVVDARTREPLPGATIIYHGERVSSTDVDGNYMMRPGQGEVRLVFQYVGYRPERRVVWLEEGQDLTMDVALEPEAVEMDQVVVSAGRVLQRLAESTVSLTVVRPEQLAAGHMTSSQEVMNKIPGLEVLDGQVSIRGGSGFSYGAGSRVLVLTDGLPAISADAGAVRWQALPLENLSQIEVIKGASSVLYGSSALNGVINFRTAEATPQGTTRFFVESGFFDKPRETNWIWWDQPRVFSSASVHHSKRHGDTELGVGAFVKKDNGYRKRNDESLGRMNLRIRQHGRHNPGLHYGVNLSGGATGKKDFILWENAWDGALKQQASTASHLHGRMMYVDPFIGLHQAGRQTHDLRMRMHWSSHAFDEAPQNNSSTAGLYAEYMAWLKMSEKLSLNAGLSGFSSRVRSNFYGDHQGLNLAAFLQTDLRLREGFTLVAGMRLEYNELNSLRDQVIPLFRAGTNVRLAQATFLRASYGQGYRYPSIAEKHAATTLGPVRILPNPYIRPESGWHAEVGIKQGLINDWLDGLIDLALFYGMNSDLIEFVFGLYPDPQGSGFGPGFRSTNVEHSRTCGMELEWALNLRLGTVDGVINGGYVFMVPSELDPYTRKQTGEYLKFRRKHAGQIGISARYQRYGLGLRLYVRSRTLAIDEVFLNPLTREEILPGFYDYWMQHNNAHLLSDLDLSVRLGVHLTVSLAVKNLWNVEYMGRPGDIQPHRNFGLRLSGEF